MRMEIQIHETEVKVANEMNMKICDPKGVADGSVFYKEVRVSVSDGDGGLIGDICVGCLVARSDGVAKLEGVSDVLVCDDVGVVDG